MKNSKQIVKFIEGSRQNTRPSGGHDGGECQEPCGHNQTRKPAKFIAKTGQSQKWGQWCATHTNWDEISTEWGEQHLITIHCHGGHKTDQQWKW